jgi:hypothetical protein
MVVGSIGYLRRLPVLQTEATVDATCLYWSLTPNHVIRTGSPTNREMQDIRETSWMRPAEVESSKELHPVRIRPARGVSIVCTFLSGSRAVLTQTARKVVIFWDGGKRPCGGGAVWELRIIPVVCSCNVDLQLY